MTTEKDKQITELKSECAHYATLLAQWSKFSASPKWDSEVDRKRFYDDCTGFLWNNKFKHLKWLKEREDAVAIKCADIAREHICSKDYGLCDCGTEIAKEIEQEFKQ